MLSSTTLKVSDEVRQAADDVGADATILGAFLCNSATLGTYRIQEHCRRRVKDVVEQGRNIGRLEWEKYHPLVQDLRLATRTLHETVEGGRDALRRMHCCVGRLVMGMQPPGGVESAEVLRCREEQPPS
ncbi:hypothetical protein DQ04_01601030 [Trypanosoma grayi]|uniref:hypothetical protein n=1 Tax=Trypanosoma grayi TaxID=71804 RepID=UPI0004F45C92|nr:hypothetical protein DQ04_01601030 [Trypanosoma grayi]KEG12578.1 hypothetical protein DQ04_01601030 [Trypanosoma grayi]